MAKREDIRLKDEERQPCEIWSRVMGYYRPLSLFNDGKKGEFYDRVNFAEEKACCPQKGSPKTAQKVPRLNGNSRPVPDAWHYYNFLA